MDCTTSFGTDCQNATASLDVDGAGSRGQDQPVRVETGATVASGKRFAFWRERSHGERTAFKGTSSPGTTGRTSLLKEKRLV